MQDAALYGVAPILPQRELAAHLGDTQKTVMERYYRYTLKPNDEIDEGLDVQAVRSVK